MVGDDEPVGQSDGAGPPPVGVRSSHHLAAWDGAGPAEDTPDDVSDASGSAGAADKPRKTRRGALGSLLHESVIILVAALVLSLVIKTFFAQAFYIPSSSMEDTLLIGDKFVVNKLAPGPFDLGRGDIVVFLDPGGWLPPSEAQQPDIVTDVLTFVGLLPAHADEHLIKRIVGLPGDHVICCNADGLVTINGEAIEEPYIRGDAAPSLDPFDVVVPQDHLWVMGDNRPESADSRYNLGSFGGGFVPMRNVVGTAFVIIWPLDRVTLLSNPGETFKGVPDPS